MQKQFHELSIGDKFIVNGVEFVKTEDIRISCCQVINCYATANQEQKGFFQGNTEVTING